MTRSLHAGRRDDGRRGNSLREGSPRDGSFLFLLLSCFVVSLCGGVYSTASRVDHIAYGEQSRENRLRCCFPSRTYPNDNFAALRAFCGLCDVAVLDMGNVLMTSLKRSRDKGGGHLRKRTCFFSKVTPFLFLVNCYLQRKECSSETGSRRFRPDSLVVTMRMNLSPYRVPQAWRLLCGRLHRTKTKKRIGRLCLGGNISRLPSPPNIFCRLQ